MRNFNETFFYLKNATNTESPIVTQGKFLLSTTTKHVNIVFLIKAIKLTKIC